MNSRVPLLSKLSPDRLMVLVVLLGVSFVAIVLLPGLKLAGDLVNSSAALRWVADQQRYPTIIRASLETMRDRLTNRGYLQESVDQLTDATKKFGDAVQIMTTPRPGGWLGFGMPGSVGDSIAAGRAGPLHDAWDRELQAVQPVLTFNSVPYADSESQGTVLNAAGRQLEHDLTTAIRVSRHSLPELETELTTIGAQLQAGSARAARQLQVVMLMGLLIAGFLVLLIVALLNARSKQEAKLKETSRPSTPPAICWCRTARCMSSAPSPILPRPVVVAPSDPVASSSWPAPCPRMSSSDTTWIVTRMLNPVGLLVTIRGEPSSTPIRTATWSAPYHRGPEQ